MSRHGFTSAAVIGTGMMGPGIALTLALGGLRTTILSRTADGAEQGLATARELAEVLRVNELTEPARAERAASLLDCSADLDSCVAGVDLVVESAPERMAFKQELFAHLDRVTRPDAVLASNTSGLSITAIASPCRQPGRVLTTHFWNPPYLVPLVEIVKGERTSPDVAESVRALLAECGKVPVMVQRDRPGQLGNRLQMALVREAAHMIAEGIATAEDIDLAIKNGLGLRYPAYGLLEHQDMVGLDLCLAVCDYVTRDLNSEPRAPEYLTGRVAEGKLGVKTGEGFHDWSGRSPVAVRARRDQFLIDFLRSERQRAKAAGGEA